MKTSAFRWFLCFLLFLATALCFFDRQVLSVLSPTICEEFRMSDQDYSYVTNGFLIAYAGMFFLGGLLIDRLGTRWGLGLSVLVWTVASGLHSVIRTPFQMGASRFLLGMGEGGCFPGAAKAASEWFRPKERALAVGIAIGGASLGGLAAPPMTLWLNQHFGWRGAFAATGLMGLLWCVLWFLFYHHPARSPWISSETREMLTATPSASNSEKENRCEISNKIQKNSVNESSSPKKPELPLRSLTAAVIGLAFARFLFDPIFYFYMFWIPKYLQEVCGAPDSIIRLTGIPFIAMGVTNIIGGFCSDLLVRRGFSALRSRKIIMILAALVTLASSFVPLFKGQPIVALILMSTLMFGHGFWITNFCALISDNFPQNRVATVMGISGLVGTIGGLCGNTAIGWVVGNYSYTPIWLVSGLLYPAALLLILLTFRAKKGIAGETLAD